MHSGSVAVAETFLATEDGAGKGWMEVMPALGDPREMIPNVMATAAATAADAKTHRA